MLNLLIFCLGEVMNNEDLLVFTDEEKAPSKQVIDDYWHVLVVDDEIEVHSVTKLALKNTEILGKKLKICSAVVPSKQKRFCKVIFLLPWP